MVPDFLWAQNKENIFLTIQQSNCYDVNIDITENKIDISFKSNNNEYSCLLELFGLIDVNSSTWENNRNINFSLKRVEKEYWSSLLKNKNYKNKIKTDWSRWVDEDESDDDNLDMSGMSGMPGMPGMDMQGMEEMMKNMGGMEGLQNMMGGMNPNENVENNDENDDEKNCCENSKCNDNTDCNYETKFKNELKDEIQEEEIVANSS